MYSDELSDVLRQQVQPLTKMRQLCDAEDGTKKGLNRGDLYESPLNRVNSVKLSRECQWQKLAKCLARQRYLRHLRQTIPSQAVHVSREARGTEGVTTRW